MDHLALLEPKEKQPRANWQLDRIADSKLFAYFVHLRFL